MQDDVDFNIQFCEEVKNTCLFDIKRADYCNRSAQDQACQKITDKFDAQAKAIHKSGKYCVVPRCENSVSSTPDKHFFPIPRESNLRQAWQRAMDNTENVLPIYSYCCEDHFKLEKDAENYMQFKMMGNVKLKLKPKVIPSVFACQKKPAKRLLPDVVAVAEKKAKVEKSVRHQGTQTDNSLFMRDAAVQVDLGEEVEVEEKEKKNPKGDRKKRKRKSK